MIRLALGKSTEVKKAVCNFCGEAHVCAEAHYPSEFWHDEVSWSFKWRGFLGYKLVREIDNIEVEKHTWNVHICKDCAKQISSAL